MIHIRNLPVYRILLRVIFSISMNSIFEFLIRSLIAVIWLAALVVTTVLLAPVHLIVMVASSIFQKTNVQSQWVW